MKNSCVLFLVLIYQVSISQNLCIDKVLTKKQVTDEIIQKAAFLKGKAWENGTSLNVKFMEGSDSIKNKVILFAKEWEEYANIKFNIVSSGDADIRISFVSGIGSWSYIGTDAEQIPQNEATMNFGWLENSTSDIEFKGIVLREFGHALGLTSDHKYPENGITWNESVVFAAYQKSQGWSKKEVKRRIFEKYSKSQSYYCSCDGESIMQYPIPQEHTIGDYSVELNTNLSAKDKKVISNLYPKSFDENPYWTAYGNIRYGWYVGDFNGDGKDDILRHVDLDGGAEVFLSDGSKFLKPDLWTEAGNTKTKFRVGDFNGDGKDDIFRYLYDYGGAEVMLSTGSSFSKPVKWSITSSRNRGLHVGDFNGDGKDDIYKYADQDGIGVKVLLSTGSSFSKPVEWSIEGNREKGWNTGDFNGDGKDDIFRFLNIDGGAEVMLSTGVSFMKPIQWSTASDSHRGFCIGDFNGDGKDDILRYVDKKGGAEVMLSTGNYFSEPKEWTSLSDGNQRWYIGDFNGDNKSDVFRYINSVTGAHVLISNGSQFSSDEEDCDF